MTEKISIEFGESSYERLLALGVPEERAKDWARLGPKMRATLWTNGPVGVWEVHRELSAHLRIAGWTLLNNDRVVCEAEQARRVREIVLGLCDEMCSLRFPLMKADSWADEGIFVDVLRSIGFEQVTINGNPHPIENDRDYSHRLASVEPRFCTRKCEFGGPSLRTPEDGIYLRSSKCSYDTWRNRRRSAY